MKTIENLKAPLLVSWQITRDCDLCCLHCCTDSAPGKRLSDELSANEAMRLVDEIVRNDVPYVMLCGGEPLVSREDLQGCPRCGGGVRQDEDVLDTWFSSWLWPMTTLGWPDTSSEDLRAFYPTDVLVSGPDILFFWIARMIMSGYEFMGTRPFHTVFLHGIARDMDGRKIDKLLVTEVRKPKDEDAE